MAYIEIGFFADSLGLTVQCGVILPEAKRQEGTRYPTLWLLHGAGDDHTAWTRRTAIERYVRNTNLAVVMPSAQRSTYANMVYGGHYYDYIADELPRKMRMFFPLSDRREDNFIAGLSMGGAGAMKIGLANPERYAAIGCLSAGADNFGAGRVLSPEWQKRLVMIRGERGETGPEEDVYANARRIVEQGLPAPRIFHVIGTEDFLLPQAHEARDFFRSLPGDPFDYTYAEYPGAHTWAFWDEHIRGFLNFIGAGRPE